jgi:two-component system chemotaxis sensor kinase CheA
LAGTVRIATDKLDALFRQAEELIGARLVSERRIQELRELTAMLNQGRKISGKIHTQLLALQALLQRDGHRSGAELSMWLEESESVYLLARAAAGKMSALAAAAMADHRSLTKMTDHLLEESRKLLMLPLAELFEVLPRVVRELARGQGKELELVIRGDAIEIDRRIQEKLKDPLIHLLRNCVDHGIEKPEERIRKHKPAAGKITITVTQPDAGKAEFTIADDGAGIDLAKVLAAAHRAGAVTPEASGRLENREIMELVFRSGISTSPIVTDLSGRGLGLAIALEKIEKLNGNITLESGVDTGTTFRITLPVTLSASRGVMVRSADRLFALPTQNVDRVARVRAADVKTVENRETLRLNGDTLSLVRLSAAMGLSDKNPSGQADALLQVVVVSAAGERVAFAVDEIQGEQELLLKGLGEQLVRVRNIAGSTALGSGELVPFLSVPDLIRASAGVQHAPGVAGPEQTAVEREKSVLVVEDSITARALLKNILEAAGYRVKTAVDGIDAMTGLKTESFDLVVSDVEMPRMDGFELTEKIRADRKLAEIPVVLVTALESREHRERGIDAGANAYIAKSGFDESGLLDVIRRFI